MAGATVFDSKVEAAIAALDHKVDAGLTDVARVARAINDQYVMGRDPQAAAKEDVVLVGKRIDALTGRIDILAERIAATGPRLANTEAMIADLRAGSARRSDTDGLERRLRQLSKRVDSVDQRQNSRTTGLSNQVTAWLVSLLLLVVGAMVSYTFVGH